MSQHGIAQGPIGKPCDHRNLHRRHDLSGTNPKASEAKDAIVLYRDESFEKSSCFHKGARPQYRGHGNLEQAVRYALRSSLLLTQADPREFRVRI